VFSEKQFLPMSVLIPENIIGMSSMHPVEYIKGNKSNISVKKGTLIIKAEKESKTAIWLGGFNPFATYSFDLQECMGHGELSFEFTDVARTESFVITVLFKNELLSDVQFEVTKGLTETVRKSVGINLEKVQDLKGKFILQMLGSGFVLYLKKDGSIPLPIGQGEFNKFIDLRAKKYIQNFHTNLLFLIKKGDVIVKKARIGFSTGTGQSDIRAITYENGAPFLDKGRVWYTMTVRGRSLPEHTQGVFSLNPTLFDIKFEGIIVFDRNDGILRNEVASHIFYDRNDKIWKGITTGFSAFANPEKEKKQLLIIESKKDPRFGFSVMKARPFKMVGDIEDPHIIYDEKAKKWRILTCENTDNGYRAIMMESDFWDKSYVKIAGPVNHNSTGTSIQKIGNKQYCFSGSSERKIFVYSYPDLKEVKAPYIDIPPWDKTSGTRVWPDVIQLPEGYFCRYIALMMDRYNYPGLKKPNWSYGALYLYYGYDY